jgi:hypothetical protein
MDTGAIRAIMGAWDDLEAAREATTHGLADDHLEIALAHLRAALAQLIAKEPE